MTNKDNYFKSQYYIKHKDEFNDKIEKLSKKWVDETSKKVVEKLAQLLEDKFG